VKITDTQVKAFAKNLWEALTLIEPPLLTYGGLFYAEYIKFASLESLEDDVETLKVFNILKQALQNTALHEAEIGVGSGDTDLFVHGDYEAVKRVQKIIFENEELHNALYHERGRLGNANYLLKTDTKLAEIRRANAEIERLRKENEALRFWTEDVYPDGVTAEQLADELIDYAMILKNVGRVYCHVTGGKVSKANTDAEVVCALADDFINEIVQTHKPSHEELREIIIDWLGWRYVNSVAPEFVGDEEVDALIEQLLDA
jgi:hypothetical protein